MSRLVAWWSAGTTSAVAAILALRTMARDFDEVVVAYCASVENDEHPDNKRFLADCERWFGVPILKLYSHRYRDLEDLWTQRRYVAGINGAPCTKYLKTEVRERFQRADDVHVFGYDDGEHDRAAEWLEKHPGLVMRFPLIERGLSHPDADAIVLAADIALPAMYLEGFRNNNCIGCIKAGAGYWNLIRDKWPDLFERRARLFREIGYRPFALTIDGVRRRIFLDELPRGVGRYETEPAIQCGAACSNALAEIEVAA